MTPSGTHSHSILQMHPDFTLVADEDAFTNVDAQGVIYDPSQIEVIPADGAEVTVTEVVEEAEVNGRLVVLIGGINELSGRIFIGL